MSTHAATAYLDAIRHLPAGATLSLDDVSWDEYEALLAGRDAVRKGARLFYDDGRLLVMTTSLRHERPKELILRVVQEFARLTRVVVETGGSTTIKRKASRQGGEADTCFYVQHAADIIGKGEVDLAVHPPDVVVEVEIHCQMTARKRAFYASLGVPEIWRYDERQLRILQLSGRDYRLVTESVALPGLTSDLLTSLLEHSKTAGQTAAVAALAPRLGR